MHLRRREIRLSLIDSFLSVPIFAKYREPDGISDNFWLFFPRRALLIGSSSSRENLFKKITRMEFIVPLRQCLSQTFFLPPQPEAQISFSWDASPLSVPNKKHPLNPNFFSLFP